MVRKQYKKWEACWNENKIQKYQYFDNEQEAIKFENEKRALNKLQRQKQRQKQSFQKEKLMVLEGKEEKERNPEDYHQVNNLLVFIFYNF